IRGCSLSRAIGAITPQHSQHLIIFVKKSVAIPVETYTTIPPTWKLVNEDKGITINTDTEISTDAQSLSDLLPNLTGISNAVTEQVGKDIPLRLLENGKKDYSVVFKNGQVTDYNEVFKKVIE
ncbi:MAG: hypothetical protein E7E38_18880, partial [Enterococcus avium]|nr:hypothetical protein [Enterococcus avium]MDU6622062.1 hypothetical protein [Enterococcus avium]